MIPRTRKQFVLSPKKIKCLKTCVYYVKIEQYESMKMQKAKLLSLHLNIDQTCLFMAETWNINLSMLNLFCFKLTNLLRVKLF